MVFFLVGTKLSYPVYTLPYSGYKQKQLLENASKEKQSPTELATCGKFSVESFASGEVKRKFKRYMR